MFGPAWFSLRFALAVSLKACVHHAVQGMYNTSLFRKRVMNMLRLDWISKACSQSLSAHSGCTDQYPRGVSHVCP